MRPDLSFEVFEYMIREAAAAIPGAILEEG